MDIFMLIKTYRKYEIWQTNENLRRHFLLNCRRVIYIIIPNVQPYRWQGTSPWRGLKKSNTDIWRDRLLLLQNTVIASKHPNNSSPSCCSMLLVQTNVLKHLDEDCNESKLLSLLHNCPGPLLRLRLSFFKGALLLGIKKIAHRELLITKFST